MPLPAASTNSGAGLAGTLSTGAGVVPVSGALGTVAGSTSGAATGAGAAAGGGAAYVTAGAGDGSGITTGVGAASTGAPDPGAGCCAAAMVQGRKGKPNNASLMRGNLFLSMFTGMLGIVCPRLSTARASVHARHWQPQAGLLAFPTTSDREIARIGPLKYPWRRWPSLKYHRWPCPSQAQPTNPYRIVRDWARPRCGA
jgi:hypothetical protein